MINVILGYIDPGSGFTLFSFGGWLAAILAGFLGFFLAFFRKIFNFLKKHRRFAIIIVISAILAVVCTNIFMKNQQTSFNCKIVILGFDGLSPKIVEAMMAEGKLPAFKKLAQTGSYRHLATTNPAQSPVAWSGFITGKNPGKHGIYDFVARDPKTYKLKLSLSDVADGRPKPVLKSKGFWHYTSEKRVPAVILECPMTFPAQALYGRMISGMGTPDILGTEGTFSFFTTEDLKAIKPIGGKVFHVNRSSVMVMHLTGPRIATLLGKTENTKIPFKATFKDRQTVTIEYQSNRFDLKTGEWSSWKDVTFNVGPLKRIKGILKFYLVETEPEFKLYVSPINLDPREPFFPISYPPTYSRELAEAIGPYHTQGMPMDTWSVNEKRIHEAAFLENTENLFKETKARLDFELNRFDKGVLFSYFEFPDIIQHMFWRYIDPKHPIYEKNDAYKKTIEEWYQKMDGVLSGVMEKISDDDILIVLSDHGFDTFRRSVHVNSWLKEQGYLALKDPEASLGRELLRDIDWPKTKAYSIGFGAVYINQKGREGQGVVAPGEETEQLKQDISGKMEHWLDDKYNERVIRKVYKKEEIFHGSYAKDAPDLFIGFNIGYESSWQTALGGVMPHLIEDNQKKWSGSHLFDPALIPGIIFSNRKIQSDAPSIYDIAPTILHIIGYRDEEIESLDMDGRPLFR